MSMHDDIKTVLVSEEQLKAIPMRNYTGLPF